MKDPARTSKVMPGKEVADLLAGFAPEVRNLAPAERAFVLEMTPDISERVDVKARMIGYSYCQKYDRYGRHDHADQSGSKSGHCLCDELPDPKKLLEGTGKLHRHVKLKSMSDLESAALKALLTASIAATVRRREKAAQKAKK